MKLNVLLLAATLIYVSGCTGKATPPRESGTLPPVTKATIEQSVIPKTPAASNVSAPSTQAQSTPPPAQASTPIAPPAPQPAPPAAKPGDNSAYQDVGNALACDAKSGRPPLQAQDLFELEYFEKAAAIDLGSGATLDQYLKAVLQRLAKVSPLRAKRMETSAAAARASSKPVGLGDPKNIGPTWIPDGCKLVYVLLKSDDGDYALNMPVWNSLPPTDQAAILIHAAAVPEATRAESESSTLTARHFLRLIFEDKTPDMNAALHQLGPYVVLEKPFQNGDVGLYFDNVNSYASQEGPDVLFACGYSLANGANADNCVKAHLYDEAFRVFSAGMTRVLRIIDAQHVSYKAQAPRPQSTVYLVDPTQVGLPASTVDYAFGNWHTRLIDPTETDPGYDQYENFHDHPWRLPNVVQIRLTQDTDFNRSGIGIRCQATGVIDLYITDPEIQSYKVSFSEALLGWCRNSAPMRLNIGGKSAVIPVNVADGGDAYGGDRTKPLTVQVAGLTSPQTYTLGNMSFDFQNDDSIIVSADASTDINFGAKHNLKLAGPGIVSCVLGNASLRIEANGTQIANGDVIGTCSLRGPHSRVTAIGVRARYDATTGTINDFDGGDYGPDEHISLEVAGQKFPVARAFFNSSGDVSAILAGVPEGGPIKYYNDKDGKMETSVDYGGDATLFCFNPTANRLDRYTPDSCPTKYTDDFARWGY